MDYEVYWWMVNVLGIPFEMNTSKPRPAWVDTYRLALAWVRWDQENCGSAETVDEYKIMIEDEWPREA